METQTKEFKSAKFIDLLGLALRIFKVRPFRTIMTILGIGVSFATIFFLLSLGYGLQNILLSQISSEQALRTIDVATANSALLPLSDSIISDIKKMSGVQKVEPLIASQGQIEIGNLATETTIQSIPGPEFKSIYPKIQEGELPDPDQDGIAITAATKELLGSDYKDPIGRSVKLTSFVPENVDGNDTIKLVEFPGEYKIIGITEGDSNVVYIPLSKIRNLGLPYGMLKVVTRSDKVLEPVRASIANMGFQTSALADTVEQANQIFKVFQFILALFGVAALVVAIIGMVNTMTISLLERVHEIGIMKLFGITTWDIKKLFYLESTMVGSLGGISGLLMGYIMSRMFNFIIAFLAKTLGGKPVDLFSYPSWFVLSILGFSAAVGLMIGMSPAGKASKLDPLKALNYK